MSEMEWTDLDDKMQELDASHRARKTYYHRQNAYENEHKGKWEACRVPEGPHRGDLSEWGWCEAHKYPSDRCNVVRNGDQYICRYHNRYWSTGICPGLQGFGF